MRVMFYINKRLVFDEVEKTTEYVGKMADAYEKVTATVANEEMLMSFMKSAGNELTCAMGAYLPTVDYQEDGGENEEVTVILDMPATFDMTKRGIIENLINEFFICSMVWRWLFLCLPEKGNMWEMKAMEVKGKIFTNINARVTRSKKRTQPF